MRFCISLLLLFSFVPVFGQSPEKTPSKLTISGYVDAYYATFSDSLPPNALQQYTTVSPRQERIGLNIAQLSLAYAHHKIRSAITLHAGDIAVATWSDEFRLVQEANVGVKLKDALWLDAGFFATHIGTESFLPKEDMLSSTAVATYNEPFYQSGARLSYEPEGKWGAQLWVLNGYNRFLDNNDAKSIGALLNYTPSENLSITYTNLFGKESDEGATISQFRTYQNLYLETDWKDKLFLVVGGDFSSQTNSTLDANPGPAYLYNCLLTTRYQFTPQFSATVRGERFSDRWGYVSGLLTEPGGALMGLQLWGLTAGVEYAPTDGAYLRLEGRHIKAENTIFFTDGAFTNKRNELMLTFGLAFEKVFAFSNDVGETL